MQREYRSMKKKTISPKIRMVSIAVFALAIVLSTVSVVMQSSIQSASAKNYFEDPDTGDIYSCDNQHDRVILTDDDVICLD